MVFDPSEHLHFGRASPTTFSDPTWAMPALTLPALQRTSDCSHGAWDDRSNTTMFFPHWCLVFKTKLYDFTMGGRVLKQVSPMPVTRYREAELAHGRVCMLAVWSAQMLQGVTSWGKKHPG